MYIYNLYIFMRIFGQSKQVLWAKRSIKFSMEKS